MSYLGKEFKFVKQENFEEFVNALPAPEEVKQKLITIRPTQKLVLNGDTYTLYSTYPDRTSEISFKNGVEFDEKVREDLTAKTTITISGDTFTQVQVYPQGSLTIKREYAGDELVTTFSVSGHDVVGKRFYKP